MPSLTDMPDEILYMIVKELRSAYTPDTGSTIYSLLYVSQQLQGLALDVYYGCGSLREPENYAKKLYKVRRRDATALSNQHYRKLAYKDYDSDQDFMNAYVQVFMAEPYNRDRSVAIMAAGRVMSFTTSLREFTKRRRLTSIANG